MEITEDDAESLAAKLAALELSPGERAALDAVFDAASTAEAEGFTIDRADRYFSVIRFETDNRYIGETEKNVSRFVPDAKGVAASTSDLEKLTD